MPQETTNHAPAAIIRQSGCLPFILLILAIAVAVMAYFLGRKNGNQTIENIAMNNALIQQIAELSSLEVQGAASIKSSNILNDGSISDGLRKLFLERTINITVPYTAKYGVNLDQQNITIEEKKKEVYIVLPTPKLLSFELRIDKADAMTRSGLFESGNDNRYNEVEKKLYTQSRAQLEQNTGYVEQTKEKIRKILIAYYQPLHIKTEIVFSDEIKSRVLPTTPQ